MKQIAFVVLVLAAVVFTTGQFHQRKPKPGYAIAETDKVVYDNQKFRMTQCLWDTYPKGTYRAKLGTDGTIGGSITFFTEDGKVVTSCSVVDVH